MSLNYPSWMSFTGILLLPPPSSPCMCQTRRLTIPTPDTSSPGDLAATRDVGQIEFGIKISGEISRRALPARAVPYLRSYEPFHMHWLLLKRVIKFGANSIRAPLTARESLCRQYVGRCDDKICKSQNPQKSQAVSSPSFKFTSTSKRWTPQRPAPRCKLRILRCRRLNLLRVF